MKNKRATHEEMIRLFNQIKSYITWWTNVQISFNNVRESRYKRWRTKLSKCFSLYISQCIQIWSIYSTITNKAKSSIYTWASVAIGFSKKPQVHMANLLRLGQPTDRLGQLTNWRTLFLSLSSVQRQYQSETAYELSPSAVSADTTDEKAVGSVIDPKHILNAFKVYKSFSKCI